MLALEKRLRGRATDSPETIARRLAIAEREIGEVDHFDYLIVNDDLDRAVDAFVEIVGAVRAGETARLEKAYGQREAFQRWQEHAQLARASQR